MTDENPHCTAPLKWKRKGPLIRFLRATEIDARLLGMIAALVLIWVGFHCLWPIGQRLWGFPNAPQPLEPVRADRFDRRDGHRVWCLVIVTRHIDLICRFDLGFFGDGDGHLAGLDTARSFWVLGHPLIWVITVSAWPY